MKIAIVGTGLMGASVALAAQRRGDDVVGWDAEPAALAAAVGVGAVEAAASLEEAVSGVELAVVAVADRAAAGDGRGRARRERRGDRHRRRLDQGVGRPGRRGLAALRRRAPDLRLRDARRRERDRRASSRAQPGSSPRSRTPIPARHRLVHGFVSDLGATPVAIDADAHDRLVAMTSHVPHVLANIVANQTGASRVDGHEPLAHAGGSLRDMTRIAGANPRIWIDIFLDNADAIRGALAEQRRLIEQVEAALEQGDAGFLARWIGEASSNRRRMLEREYPDPGSLQRLRVHVPDRPGVLAGITQALGAERINIEDFELHHVSPERGGTLTLLVEGEGEAQRAATMLESQGYSVVISAVHR